MASTSFEKALGLHKLNQFAEAVKFYESSSEVQGSSHFEAVYFAGLAYLNLKKFELAKEYISRAIRLFPDHKLISTAYFNLSHVNNSLSDPASARSNLISAVELNPNLTEALVELVQVCIILSRYDEALSAIDKLLIKHPQNHRLLSNKGYILKELNDLKGAIKSCDDAININPNYAPAYNNKGICYFKNEKFHESIECFLSAIKLKIDYAEAHYNLANALVMVKNYTDAENGYTKAIEHQPDFIDAYIGLSNLFKKTSKLDQALGVVEQALRLDPYHIKARQLSGQLNAENNNYSSAIEDYRNILSYQPNEEDEEDARFQLGWLFEQLGKFHEAKEEYESGLKINPNSISVRSRLAILNAEHGLGDDSHFHYLNQYVNLGDNSLRGLDDANFALGNDFDRKGMYDRAFHHYQIGNEIKNKNASYDHDWHSQFVNNIINCTSREWFEKSQKYGYAEPGPIFVLGMPRSGTTLTETILSQHAAVTAAGEVNFFSRSTHQIKNSKEVIDGHFSCVDQNEIFQIGNYYFKKLMHVSGNYPFVTDKMPDNFHSIGLIAATLPCAKIIHVRRNPIDVCLSNFQQNFNLKLGYSFDLINIANYYKNYWKLMEHWRSIMPEKCFLEIDYEDLITEPHSTIKKMLSYCELEWDENCMRFSSSTRAIKTASINQVRKELYKTSIAKWRRYEKNLSPLIDKLSEFLPPKSF